MDPGAETSDATPTFEFTADEAGSTFQCSLDGAVFEPCTSPHTTTTLTEGMHTFAAQATDPGGNTDPSPASHTFTVDTTPPEVDLTRPEPGFTYTNDSPRPRADEQIMIVDSVTVQAVATDALSGIAAVVFDVDGDPVPAGAVSVDSSTSTWSFTFTATANGRQTYVIGVTATDVAGHSSSDSITVLGIKIGRP